MIMTLIFLKDFSLLCCDLGVIIMILMWALFLKVKPNQLSELFFICLSLSFSCIFL